MKGVFHKSLSVFLALTLALTLLPAFQLPAAAAVVNSAPTAANTSVAFPAITEDASGSSNTGITVSQLLKLAGASDADGNTLSIAVTSVDDSNGTWQLYYDNGWWNLTRYKVQSNVSDSNVYLVPNGCSIRYNPGADFNGQAFFTFRVWDETTGTADNSDTSNDANNATIDASGSNNSGSTAFSAKTITASITVTSVNDAPEIHKTGLDNSIKLDGSNDYVQAAGDLGLNDDSFTVEGWIKVCASDYSSTSYSRFFEFANAQGESSGYNLWAGFEGTAGTMSFEAWDGPDRDTQSHKITTAEKLALNKWVYVSVIYNSSAHMGYIYWNGVQKAAGTVALTDDTNRTRQYSYFGRSFWTADAYFNGEMRNISVWKEARTAGEVASDMNASFSGTEDNLVLYYPLDDTVGSTTIQSTTGDNTGSLMNYSSSNNKETSTANDAMIVNDDAFDYQVSGLVNANIPVDQMYLKDVDAGAAGVSLTLTTANSGTLTVNATDGVTVTNNSSSSLTLSGTVDDINRALKTLTYKLPSVGSDTINVSVADDGHTGDGDTQSAVQSIGVTVNAVPAGTPSITLQSPVDTTVKIGDTAEFSVTASADPSTDTLTYQWQKSTDGGSSWTKVGTDSDSYTTGNTTESDNGTQYRCDVYDGNNNTSAVSDKATLTVTYPILKMAGVTPANGATGVPVDTKLTMTFNEAVTGVSGKYIHIAGPSGMDAYKIDAGDSTSAAAVGSTVTVTLPGSLDYTTKYHILIDDGAFIDINGTDYAGLSNAAAWCFTAAAAPAGLSVLLGSATESNSLCYFRNAIVTGSGIQTILLSFSDAVSSGDSITLPAAPAGFTVSTTSQGNNYTKRINVDTTKVSGGTDDAPAVQSYLQNIGFALGSLHTAQSVKVTVTTVDVEYDTFYDIDTQHYYQYISGPTAWTDAYNAAKGMSYMGRTGYLATVTSLDEDTLVNSLSGGEVGWLGGTTMNNTGISSNSLYYNGFDTDAANCLANWYWACGPEIGTTFYYGRTSNRTNNGDGTNPYWNWYSGEPNYDQSKEDCLTTLPNVSATGNRSGQHTSSFSWNDIFCSDENEGGYAAQGYFVEYGNLAKGSKGEYSSAFASDGGTISSTSYSPAVNVKINGEAADASGTVALELDDQTYYMAKSSTGVYTASSVPAGTYDIYIGGADSGVDITVTSSSSSADIDYSSPVLSSETPADGSTGISVGTGLTMNFAENVKAVSGKQIYVYRSTDNTAAETVNAGDSKYVTVSGNSVTVSLPYFLESGTDYYVKIDAGAFTNTLGNAPYAGISDSAAWNFTTLPSCTVTYAWNYSGASEPYTTQSVASGYRTTAPATPVRTGYNFRGWYENTPFNDFWNFNTDTVTADVTLCAKWEKATKYTVTYSAGAAGTGSVPTDTTAYASGGTASVKGNTGSLARAGYTFSGWSNGTTTYKAGDTFTVTGNVTLTAEWTMAPVTAYTVTYSNNYTGGDTFTKTAGYGSTLTEPSAPTRNGYTFLGWYKDTAGMNAWNFSLDTVSRDFTLYAKWTDDTYSVSGDVGTDSGTAVAGATVTVMQGNQQFGTAATTDVNGAFTVTGVPDGKYDIVITYYGQKVILYITVNGSDYICSDIIRLPDGNKNSRLEILGSDTPNVVEDGLDNEFSYSTSYDTSTDGSVVTAGGTVEIKMTVQKNDDSENRDTVKAAMNSSGYGTGLILDLDLMKTVTTSGGEVQEKTAITETGGLITLFIPLPADLQGKDSYVVYRAHDYGGSTGLKVDAITTAANSNGEYITVNGDKTYITLHAKYFSTYAIGYPVSSSGGDSADTSNSDSYYNITTTSSTGGSVTSSGSSSVASGKSITYTITPDEGYYISDVLVDGVSVGAVSSYTFKDVTKTHTIQAVLAKIVALPYYLNDSGSKVFIGFASNKSGTMKYIAPDGVTVQFTPNKKNFTDIADNWGKSYIDFVTQREIFIGTTPNVFSPDTGMTRAMFAGIIGRLYERSYGALPAGSAQEFTDVNYNHYYGKYVDWESENNIIMGIGGGLFAPDRKITRQEMAMILYRFALFLGASSADYKDTQLAYPDTSSISSWASDGAKYCQQTGIILGHNNGYFVPRGTATRAEVTAILERFIELKVK